MHVIETEETTAIGEVTATRCFVCGATVATRDIEAPQLCGWVCSTQCSDIAEREQLARTQEVQANIRELYEGVT